MDNSTLHIRTKWILVQVCIHDVFKDEYFLHYPCLSCLKPKLIAARNPVFSKSKDFSTQQQMVF